jgi:serine/threonine protein kinase/GTPase SAR1 family protein
MRLSPLCSLSLFSLSLCAVNLVSSKAKQKPNVPLVVLLGSTLSAMYLYANYQMTANESARKADEKLALGIRRSVLSMARSAILKAVEAVRAGDRSFLATSDDVRCIAASGDVIRAETVEAMRRTWALSEVQAAFWRMPWFHPQSPDIPIHTELSWVFNNVKPLFAQTRVCLTSLAARFLFEFYLLGHVPPPPPQLVQLKQCAVFYPRDTGLLPAGSNQRSGAMVYCVDLCALRSRTLADELELFRGALRVYGQQLARSCVFLLFTNMVQFVVDIERDNIVYVGLAAYQGPPGCATSMYKFVEKHFAQHVPPTIVLHLMLPKVNSRFDFVERAAPLIEQWTSRYVGGLEPVPTAAQRVVRRHARALDADVERQPGSLPMLSLAGKSLSLIHLLDAPSSWSDVAHLDLSNNRIEAFPLRLLTSMPLHSLLLANNALSVIEPSIQNFVEIRKLDLSHNALTAMPRTLAALLQLRELRLAHNKVESLSLTVLQRCVGLEVLDLGHNRLARVPPEIGRLEKLKMLQLSSNALTTLPNELGRCAALRLLGLADNAMVQLPVCLAQLTALESLDLERNRLACALARSSIVVLTQLQLLALDGNDGITDVAPALLKKAKGDARGLLRQLERIGAGGVIGTRRARLLVVGNSAAGKSALVRALVRNEPIAAAAVLDGGAGAVLSDGNVSEAAAAVAAVAAAGGAADSARLARLARGGSATAEFEAVEWNLEVDGHGTVTYSVWDVPDNELYRALLGTFLPAKCMVLVAWDVRAPAAESLESWLSAVRTLSPHSTVALVMTHDDDAQCDKRVQDQTWSALERRYLQRFASQVHAVHSVSCTTMNGVAELRASLAQHAPSGAAPDVENAAAVEQMSKVVRDQRYRARRVLRHPDMQPLAQSMQLSEKSMAAVLRHIADISDIVFLDSADTAPSTLPTGSIEPLVLTEPRWLGEVVAPLLLRGLCVDEHGVLRHSLVPKIWPELRTVVRHAILGALYDNESLIALPARARWAPPTEPAGAFIDAAYSFADVDAMSARSVLANRLARVAPSLALLWPATLGAAGAADGTVELRRVVKLNYVPPALVARLVACLSAFVCVEHVWRGGAIVRGRSNARALLALDERRSVLVVSVRAMAPAMLMNVVMQTTRALLTSWYSVEHSIYVVCSHCLAGVAAAFAKADALPEHVTPTDDFAVIEAAARAPLTAWRLSNVLSESYAGEAMTCGSESVPIDAMIPDLSLGVMHAECIDVDALELGPVIGHGAYGEVYSGVFGGQRVAIKELRDAAAEVDQFANQSAAVLSGGGGGGGGGGAARGKAGQDDDDYGDYQANNDEDRSSRNTDAFAHEVRIMSRLRHPNVVRMHGFTRVTKRLVVMELVPHGDLYTLLNGAELGGKQDSASSTFDEFSPAPLAGSASGSKRVQLNWVSRLRIAIDIARGMAYLHSLHPAVCHRDLKSPNVFMASLDERSPLPMAKVADFGLSTLMYTPELRQTLKARAVENPTWLAPEVLSERAYGLPSDVYAFGIMLWELYTQSHPFREFNFRFLFNQEAAVLEGKRPTFPTQCELIYASLASRCWAQRPSERPTFERVVDDLTAIARQLAPTALQPVSHVDNDPYVEHVTAIHVAEPPLPLRGTTLRMLSGAADAADAAGPSSPRGSIAPASAAAPAAATSEVAAGESDYDSIPGGGGGGGATASAASGGGAVSCMALMPSKSQVVCGTTEGDLLVFNALSGERVQRVVAAHSSAVLDVAAVSVDSLSEMLVCSVAQTEALTWSLARDGRGDALQRAGVLQVRIESSVDGDNAAAKHDVVYNGVTLERVGEATAAAAAAGASAAGASDDDEARAKKRFVELRTFSLALFKESKGRAVSGVAQRTLWLDDAEFVSGSASALLDSARYVGVLRARGGAAHLWTSGGVGQRDQWREALRRAVAQASYPRQFWKLRPRNALHATDTFVPRCVAAVGGALWLGCDGMRIGVLDAATGAPLYLFQLDAPLPLVLSSVKLIGVDAFDSGDVQGSPAVPISFLRPTGDGSLLLGVGDRLVALALSDCQPERLDQLARVASGSARLAASAASAASSEPMAAELVAALAASPFGAACHFAVDVPMSDGGAGFPGGLSAHMAALLGTTELGGALGMQQLPSKSDGGRPSKSKASLFRSALDVVSNKSLRRHDESSSSRSEPSRAGAPAANAQHAAVSFQAHSFADTPVSPPSLVVFDGAAPGALLSVDLMAMSVAGGVRLFAVCGSTRGVATFDVRAQALVLSGDAPAPFSSLTCAVAVPVAASHAVELVGGGVEGLHAIDRRGALVREWQHRPASAGVRVLLRVGSLVWAALSDGRIAVVQ